MSSEGLSWLCPRCGLSKPVSEYPKRQPGASRASYCKPCMREYARDRQDIKLEQDRARRLADPVLAAAKDRAYKLKSNYNITVEQYDEMLVGQDGLCGICRKTNPSGKPLGVDHDHKCCPGHRSCGMCIRGLLCDNCNTKLGWLERWTDEVETWQAKPYADVIKLAEELLASGS